MILKDVICLKCHEPMRGVKDYSAREMCVTCDGDTADDITSLIQDAIEELVSIMDDPST